MEFKLIDVDSLSKTDPLAVTFDCFSVFESDKGILLVFGFEEVLSIKLSVTKDHKNPLKHTDIARIKGVQGVSIVKDSINSFLLTKGGKIFVFKSFKKIAELPSISNVKLIQCFFNSTYVLVYQNKSKVRLKLFSSSEDGFVMSSCSFDLSFPTNAALGSRNDEKINVELFETDLKHIEFLDDLLACDLENESVAEILLVSIDEKLMWIKYKDSFVDGAAETDFEVETIFVAKAKIQAVKYFDGMMIILDEMSVLTSLSFCNTTKLIRKKEIPLEGIVECFRFYENFFIYSDLQHVNFIDLKNPGIPTKNVDLKGIVCFTVVENLEFIIAICWNQLFYYIPIPKHGKQIKDKSQFEDLPDSEIELIPEVARFLEIEEKNLVEIEKKLKEALQLKILLTQLSTQPNFVAGEAIIKFTSNFSSEISPETLFCKLQNPICTEFIEIKIKLSTSFLSMDFKIIFNRHSSSGLLEKTLKIENARESFNILMPSEVGDDSGNEMSLELVLKRDIKGQRRFVSFPISIQVLPSNKRRFNLSNEVDKCLELITKMKT